MRVLTNHLLMVIFILIQGARLSLHAELITKLRVFNQDHVLIKEITDTKQLDAFTKLWLNRSIVEPKTELAFTYFVDVSCGNQSTRWRYDKAGFAIVLSKVQQPIYHIQEFKQINYFISSESTLDKTQALLKGLKVFRESNTQKIDEALLLLGVPTGISFDGLNLEYYTDQVLIYLKFQDCGHCLNISEDHSHHEHNNDCALRKHIWSSGSSRCYCSDKPISKIDSLEKAKARLEFLQYRQSEAYKPKLQFLGHASFQLSNDDTCIVTDPVYEKRYSILSDRFIPKPDQKVLAETSIILISHAHPDHLNTSSLEMFNDDALIICSPNTAKYLGKQTKQVVQLKAGMEYVYKTTKIEAVPAKHASGRHSFANDDLGGALGFVVTMNEKVVYFTGDTEYFADMNKIRKEFSPDVVIANIGVHLPEKDVLKLYEDMGKVKMIASHHGAYNSPHADKGREYLKNLKRILSHDFIVMEPFSMLKL